MRKRPAIKAGDVCKFHKRHRLGSSDVKVVVESVSGDGIDGRSHVRYTMFCPSGDKKPAVSKGATQRKYLWYTGYNVNDNKATKRKSDKVAQTQRKDDWSKRLEGWQERKNF